MNIEYQMRIIKKCNNRSGPLNYVWGGFKLILKLFCE